MVFYAVWWYLLYLFVGSVIVASMGTSFTSIQRRHPVWSCVERKKVLLLNQEKADQER